MRVIIAFILIICLGTTAKIYAQTVTLNETNASPEAVFKKIEKQTGYHFIYTQESLDKSNKINIAIKNTALNEALTKIFSNQSLDFTIYNRQIIIKQREAVADKEPNLIIKEETYAITGMVSDEKGETLPGATVFIANSQKATPTNENGKFTLTGLAPGTYDVVVKMLGYNIYNRLITVKNAPVELNAKLQENIIALNMVNIKGLSALERQNYLPLFIKYFIGESENADKCTLSNPEDVNLSYNKADNVLEATSDKFLVIKNKSLGYEVHYLLTEFKMDLPNQLLTYDGVLYFKELTGSRSQREKWAKNRQLTYEGSIWHFFKAAYTNSLAKEGFLIYQLPDVQAENKVNNTNFKDVVPLAHPDSLFSKVNENFKLLNLQPLKRDSAELYVIYTKRNESDRYIKSTGIQIIFKNKPVPFEAGRPEQLPFKIPYPTRQVTILHPVLDSMLFDKNGNILPEKAILPRGYWSWERVADLFPPDFNTPSVSTQKIPLVKEIKTIVSAIDTTHARLPVEKLYLQTDRPNYVLNDTLHFKSYLFDADFLTPSYRSGLLYVELDDAAGAAIKRIMVPMASGISWGDIVLDEKQLSEGNYTLRAYTNWMRNFGDDYIFKKNISIVKVNQPKPAASTDAILQSEGEDIKLQFMPEGGNMVAGIPTKVGFKATNENGKGIFVSGTVYNDKQQKVSVFKSDDYGIGSFELIPQQGETYVANAVLPGNTSKQFMLPKANVNGVALRIDNTNTDSLQITLSATENIVNENEINPTTYYLIAQARGIVCYASLVSFKQGTIKRAIAKSLFPAGITRFFVLNANKNLLNERLVYIDHNEDMQIAINTNKLNYAPRDSVALLVSVKDKDGKPLQGTFSVSVTDDSQVKTDITDNISNNFFLTSDLKNKVDNPGYYFEGNVPARTADLDNLMLTGHWIGYDWQQVFEPKQLKFAAQPEFLIQGRVVDAAHRTVPKASVLLLSQNPPLLKDTLTDKNGRFVFKGIFPVDSAVFKLKASSRNAKIGNLFIDMSELDAPVFTTKALTRPQQTGTVTISATDIQKIVELKYLESSLPGIQMVTITGNRAVAITSSDLKGPSASGTYLYKPLPFTRPKQFYRPVYTGQSSKVAFGTDTRATIHWEPNLVTDGTGKAIVSFYCADRPTTYTITIEGTDLNGNIGYYQQKIKVSPNKPATSIQ